MSQAQVRRNLLQLLRLPQGIDEPLRFGAQYGGAFLGLCAVALLWLGIFHHLSEERQQAELGAVQNTSNLARTFEEHIIRSIRAVDQTLLYVRDSYAKDPAHFDISLWSRNSQFLTDLTFQVAIIDKDGFLLATNLGPVPVRMDLRDREHFRVHAESARDELFISKPVFGRASGKWSIQLTRKSTDRTGPSTASSWYRSTRTTSRASINRSISARRASSCWSAWMASCAPAPPSATN